MKKFIYLFAIVFIASLTQAQNVPFDKKLFKEQKEEFKIAKKNLDDGTVFFEYFPSSYLDINDQYYINRLLSYREALPFLFKANKFNSNNAELNYKIGRCYLMNSVYKEKSVPHFEKALKLDPNVANDIQYHLGISYHLTMQFDKAITAFNKYKSVLVTKSFLEITDVKKRIEECETGKKLVKSPKRVFIDNLGRPVNGKYPEYGAIISTDESIMMFTSKRNTSTGVGNAIIKGGYDEDIYITRQENGKWSSPKNMGPQINTIGNDATVALSPDGQSILIYKDDSKKGGGDLFECKLVGNSWSRPKALNKNINTKYHESSASYSSDGKTLYFVSNKPGGIGNHDMYVAHWDNVKNGWGVAKNLGTTLNTIHNEEAILIHPDGKTLYFSSQGHKTMGGYDIFKSILKDDGSWGIPENMGYPINTVDDDLFFVINASGRRGYYSSFKADGQGEKDIYMITFLGEEKPFQLSSEDNLLASIAKPVREKVIEKEVVLGKKITILKGIVSDCKTNKPVEATIDLIDVDLSKILATFKSNATTGKYLMSLPSGKNYGLIVKQEGYLFHSENFDIPKTATYQEVQKNVCLKKIEIGSVIVLKNIFYDYNKSTLRDASKNELDRLTKLLTENPTIKIELSAHTDSRGKNEYNQNLSQKRAQSCVDYLIQKGIGSSRLLSKGYGETRLIKSDTEIAKLRFKDDKESAHQENRRTEFKIISK